MPWLTEEQLMSRENVDVVRRQFDAFEHGGLDGVARFWHPDLEAFGTSA